MSENGAINDVSDTSLWVAYYRAKETERPDALFRDPLAKVLIGNRGQEIADSMSANGIYTEWTTILRTVMIDEMVLKMVQDGVDTVINLGAGMDTRPYRMKLPADLNWIEVDFPNVIAFKDERLKNERPVCRLERVAVDLGDDEKRGHFLRTAAPGGRNVLILTEGVILYLTPDQVGKLAAELLAQPRVSHWIVEYFEPIVYPYLKGDSRRHKMRNAPFRFFPAKWNEFFIERGWTPREIQYVGKTSERIGRPMPMSWRLRIFLLLASKKTITRYRNMAGFMILKRG